VVNLLSPLRHVLRNGNPLLKFLGNAFTVKLNLQRPTPRHLWATDRPRLRYATFQRLPWRPACEQRGRPNDEFDSDRSCQCIKTIKR